MTDHPPADWYADPDDPAQLRWWDGSAWTEHRRPASSYGGGAAGPTAPIAPAGPVTSGAAIAALVMGIVSIIGCLGPITGIPAIVVGRRATRDIDAAPQSLDGRGIATAGVVTGVIGTAIWGVVAFLVLGLLVFRTG
jgi:hypothetical protein